MYKRVYLKWVDHAGPESNGWIAVEEFPSGLMSMETVGFIVEENKKFITLTNTLAFDSENEEEPSSYCGGLTIAKSLITYRENF